MWLLLWKYIYAQSSNRAILEKQVLFDSIKQMHESHQETLHTFYESAHYSMNSVLRFIQVKCKKYKKDSAPVVVDYLNILKTSIAIGQSEVQTQDLN